MDIKLTGDGTDVDMTSGGLEFVRGPYAIAQHIVTRLRTWQTESHYERAEGMPYANGILGGDMPIDVVAFFVEERILGTPYVLGLVEPVLLNLDGATRAATGSAKVRTAEDEIIVVPFTLGALP